MLFKNLNFFFIVSPKVVLKLGRRLAVGAFFWEENAGLSQALLGT